MKARYSIRIAHRDGAGDLLHEFSMIGTQPWDKEHGGAGYAISLAEHFWRPREHDTISVLQRIDDGDYVEVDGLSC
jgi:hypothetical protein